MIFRWALLTLSRFPPPAHMTGEPFLRRPLNPFPIEQQTTPPQAP